MLQLTENWGDRLFSALSRAGGKAFSNMAVGYNNVDVEAATKHGISVGNTPVREADSNPFFLSFTSHSQLVGQGVLTETTAELAAALTLAAARRVVE